MIEHLFLPTLSVAPTLVRTADSLAKQSALRTLARAMMEITDQDATDGSSAFRPFNGADRRQSGRMANSIYVNRAKRSNFFPSKLFGEPAWDIMLDLFTASKTNELRSVKAVCLASQVPEATALRHIALLRDAGLIEQKPDKTDRRRKYLSLTTSGVHRMEAYFLAYIPLGDQTQDLIHYLAPNE